MSAIKDAALQRLRPILMTSASTVLGLIPLAFATGEGCNQRIAMGTAVVGGMVVSTLLTMYIVPAIYSYISTNRIKKTTRMKQKGICMKRIIYITIACAFLSVSLQRHKFSLSRSVWKKDCKTITLYVSSITKSKSAKQRNVGKCGLPAYTGLLCRIYRKSGQY